MKLSKIASALTVAGVLATSLPANASSALFSGFGLPSSDALLTGATVVDFTSLTAGIYTSLTTGNVTFGGGGGSFVITNNLGGDYNTQGRNLQNLHGQGSTTILDFTFASPVSAFGFNFGASNEDWSLAIYEQHYREPNSQPDLVQQCRRLLWHGNIRNCQRPPDATDPR